MAKLINRKKIKMGYAYLTIAILLEVIATNFLKISDGFTKLIPSLIVIVGYSGSFFLLSLVLKTIPIGVAYALWAGVGIALVTLIAALALKQVPDLAAIAGISLIILGVVVIKVFSKMS